MGTSALHQVWLFTSLFVFELVLPVRDRQTDRPGRTGKTRNAAAQKQTTRQRFALSECIWFQLFHYIYSVFI